MRRARSYRWLASTCIARGAILLPVCCSVFLLTNIAGYAQQAKIDSLRRVLAAEIHDTTRVNALNKLSSVLSDRTPDSALTLILEAKELSNSIGYIHGEATAFGNLGYLHVIEGSFDEALDDYNSGLELCRGRALPGVKLDLLMGKGVAYDRKGNYPEAITYYHRALDVAKQRGDRNVIAMLLSNLASVYADQGEEQKSLDLTLEILEKYTTPDDKYTIAGLSVNVASSYSILGEPEKAMEYLQRSLTLSEEIEHLPLMAFVLKMIGEIHSEQGDFKKAIVYMRRGLQLNETLGDENAIADCLYSIGWAYYRIGNFREALHYARSAARSHQKIGTVLWEANAYKLMSQASERSKRFDSALIFYKKYVALNDSVIGRESEQQLNELRAKYRAGEQEQKIALLEKEKELEQSIRTAMIVGVVLLLIIAFGLYRRYLFKKRTGEQLQSSYEELKRTQQQLIHAEKMATLGELTAGVAHEIKNPLNFISNFSGMNEELVAELEDVTAGNSAAEEILSMLKGNSRKIHEHGTRADSIVNSMLMHSREVKGVRQEANINDLVREAVELAKHGSPEGKDVDVRLDLHADVSNLDVLPAEISRVVLNLVGNAIYASRKRFATDNGESPKVTIATRRNQGFLTIEVSDNGMGMTEDVKKKIFQPFFTTKPTGDGTGLGLSLSWDIVVNGHNGTIEVESEKGKGAAFIVKLPVG